ncbi:hypothetical protein PV327_006999 [Microctonus hyperodae]|uniref:Uncharacterized protein n=1 Tax=Microctonus hyperodae TaxID=165561 RepID=A0AA39KJ65_MICHY|nr:hypothetical protein PV327_006999 [Microctonus hyperodae]
MSASGQASSVSYSSVSQSSDCGGYSSGATSTTASKENETVATELMNDTVTEIQTNVATIEILEDKEIFTQFGSWQHRLNSPIIEEDDDKYNEEEDEEKETKIEDT